MNGSRSDVSLQRMLQDSLYLECLVLADEARCYFEECRLVDNDAITSLARVSLSCESLKITTRLMHSISWLLTQRAVAAGELKPRDALDPSRRIVKAPVTDESLLTGLPSTARKLIDASVDLYRRVSSLDEVLEQGMASISPALLMQQRLNVAYGHNYFAGRFPS